MLSWLRLRIEHSEERHKDKVFIWVQICEVLKVLACLYCCFFQLS